jgi:hypothetical protein
MERVRQGIVPTREAIRQHEISQEILQMKLLSSARFFWQSARHHWINPA